MKNERKIYVRVLAEFDRDGFMNPTSILWPDGRSYPIEHILEIKHTAAHYAGGVGERFTVRINGRERYLFYERTTDVTGNRPGRWFVERTAS